MTTWGGRVSPVFDVSRHALIVDVDGQRVVRREQVTLPAGSGEGQLAALQQHGVSTLLCGAVTRELATRAPGLGIELLPFLAGEVEAVVAAYLAGRLPSDELTMPGCRGRRRRGRRWAVAEGLGDEPERSEVMPNRDGTGPSSPGSGGGGGRGPRGRGGRGEGRGQGRGLGGGRAQGRGRGRSTRAPGTEPGGAPPGGDQQE